MTRSMARRLRRDLARLLAAALVFLAPGLDAHRAAAQVVTGRVSAIPSAPAVSAAPLALPTGALSVAPAVSLPAATLPSAALTAAIPAATPAPVTVAAAAKAAAPALQAVASAKSSAGSVHSAGHELIGVLTGEAAAPRSAADSAVAGSFASAASGLSAASETPSAPKGEVPGASAVAQAKTVDSAFSYRLRRAALKTVAALTGAVFTMPQAGPALTAKIIASAADKKLVLSDFDDTLAAYNEVLPAQKVEAVRAIKAAGKHFSVISDRSDTKRPNSNQLTVFESLESLPVEVRAGMLVAANSGGKVYRYDAQGVPQLVHEATPLEADKLESVKAAAAATKERLSEVGAVQHVADGKNPDESYNTYGYAMMLKAGSSEASVRGAAAILQAELNSRGIEVEVNPRFAKDPANPPYITFSIITKADAAAYIAKAHGVAAKDALVIGDAMFVPREAKKAGWLARMGERLSGRSQAKTGNETDRNMTKLLPGVLALGVGANMDPRVANGWALDGKGPDVTQKVLESVASKPAGPSTPSRGGEALENAGAAFVLVAGLAGLGAFVYGAADLFSHWLAMAEAALRGWTGDPLEMGAALGAVGMAGMLAPRRDVLSSPTETYADAHERAVKLAAERGVPAAQVSFVKATASMPVSQGKHWNYIFTIPAKEAGKTVLIYVHADRFLGGAQDLKSSVVEGPFAVPAAGLVRSLEPLYFANLGRPMLSPDAALDALRRKAPYFGTRVSLELALREEKVSGDQDLWYRFYDEKGSIAMVNLRTSEVRTIIRPGLSYAIAPNELYALAQEEIGSVASKAGVPAEKVRFLSAVHEERHFNGAWVGDEWRFHFSVNGLQYMVPARRTMVTETQMDAFPAKLEARVSSLIQGIPAADFAAAVTVTPETAIARTDREISRLTLIPREGSSDLWYSLQDGRGDEILAVNARTGEEVRGEAPARASWKSFLIWAGLMGAVALLYYGIYWAATNAPAAPNPNPGWNGPIPTIDEVFGALGAAAMVGGLRKARKPKVTDEQIEAAAKGVAASKGGVWSQTEYNMAYYNTLESLKKQGATKAQLERFRKLCDEAPVIGGRFNPWSGD